MIKCGTTGIRALRWIREQSWAIENRIIYFDISITNPLSKTVIKDAAKKQLAAAHKRESHKKALYERKCAQIDAEFIPLVIETFGGFGREFQTWINNLTLLTEHHLTLVDGESLINRMLDMIALQVVSSNGKIQQSWAPLTDERD